MAYCKASKPQKCKIQFKKKKSTIGRNISTYNEQAKTGYSLKSLFLVTTSPPL